MAATFVPVVPDKNVIPEVDPSVRSPLDATSVTCSVAFAELVMLMAFPGELKTRGEFSLVCCDVGTLITGVWVEAGGTTIMAELVTLLPPESVTVTRKCIVPGLETVAVVLFDWLIPLAENDAVPGGLPMTLQV